MSFAPKRPTAFKILENDFHTSFLKVPSFIYVCLVVVKLKKIRVKALWNFEDCLHHRMNEFERMFRCRNFHSSVAPSL